jgi:hypothetical protein
VSKNIPVPIQTFEGWINRIETARDNIIEILTGQGGHQGLPEALRDRLAGAVDQLRDAPASDGTHRVPQKVFRDCHGRCAVAALPMNTVLGLNADQKKVGEDLRDVADAMRDLGNQHGMGLS